MRYLNVKEINDRRYYAWQKIAYMHTDMSLTHDSEKQTSGCAFQIVLPFGLFLFPKCIISKLKKPLIHLQFLIFDSTNKTS